MIEKCAGLVGVEIERNGKKVNIPIPKSEWKCWPVSDIRIASLRCDPCQVDLKLIAEDQDPPTCDFKARQQLGHKVPVVCPRLFLDMSLSS